MGEGTMSLECLVNGKSLTCLIHSVQYIPALTYMLLSCKALTCHGLTITFKGDCCKVYHADGTLITESSQVPNQLYFLSIAKVNSSTMTDNNAALTAAPSFDLMHKPLAHPGKDVLQAMIRRKLAVGLDDVPDDSKDFDCEACVHGKMTRAPFQKGHDTARECLGRLHSDVCRLMETTSLGKRHYFCTLVDDKSGYTWLYPCALKSDFTEWFIKLDRLFVNQYGTHTKILCSDRGGEYVNTPLEKYCAENGIKLKFTVLHTPEQNGVTKGTNWKILDKGQAIMKDTGAPDFLWANAFATVMYAMNRTISTRAGDRTPYKAFFGTKPNVSHMRVWYSNVFIHQPKELGAWKLGEHGHPAKFLGYPEASAGYRTYDPANHKVTIIHAPSFCEEACPHPNIVFETPADNSDDDTTDKNTHELLPTDDAPAPPNTPHAPLPATPGHPMCT